MKIGNNKYYVPEFNNAALSANGSRLVANKLHMELLNFGFLLSKDLYVRIGSLPDAGLALEAARDLLNEYTAGFDIKLNPPLFPNWESRGFMSLSDLAVQILGYMFQFNGQEIYNPILYDEINHRVNVTRVTVIELATKAEFDTHFNNLLNAGVALNRAQTKRLCWVIRTMNPELESMPYIRSAEVRVAVMLELSQSYPLSKLLSRLNCQPADVLRYSAALKDFDAYKLPSDVKYANLSWQQRVAMFDFLNKKDFSVLCEAMGNNRTAWERWFKHVHLFAQKGAVRRWSNLYTAGFTSTGNRLYAAPKEITKLIRGHTQHGLVDVTEGGTLAYRTFASRITSAVETGDAKMLSALTRERPGYVFRNLNSVLNGVHRRDAEAYSNVLREVMPKVDVGILFSILGIDPRAQYRVIDVKGDTRIEPAGYGPVFDFLRSHVIEHIRSKYGVPGKVTVADELRTKTVPFLSRNSELIRGSRTVLNVSHSFVYMFMHWVQSRLRTDLDLSAVVLDKNGKAMDTVYFGSQGVPGMKHGGDLTSAQGPNGSTEYVQINLDGLRSGARYVVPAFNVYAGETFGECKVCRAGFNTSNSPHFEMSQDLVSYDVNSEARLHVPFAYDVLSNELILLDYNQKAGEFGRSVHAYSEDIHKLILATETSRKVTIGDLADMLSGPSSETSLVFDDNTESVPGEPKVVSSDNLFTLFSK